VSVACPWVFFGGAVLNGVLQWHGHVETDRIARSRIPDHQQRCFLEQDA
jgi:hypothetical protein